MITMTHECGGTILSGGAGEQEHLYCDRCDAYTYDLDGAVPDGTDRAANQTAWDAGDERSPEGKAVTDDDPGLWRVR